MKTIFSFIITPKRISAFGGYPFDHLDRLGTGRLRAMSKRRLQSPRVEWLKVNPERRPDNRPKSKPNGWIVHALHE